MTIRMIDCRDTATSALPTDVMNEKCVQDAFYCLRYKMHVADGTGRYREADAAPEYLVKARSNLFAWINEARASNARRIARRA